MSTDYKEYSDERLLQSYQKGNEVAGNVLFQRYKVSLHRYFERKISGNREDVEDLVQEAFLEALKSLEKGQSPRAFRAWLYTIATRVLAKWIKEKQKQGVQVAVDAAPEDESGQMPLTESLSAPVESLSAPVTFQPEHGTIDNELGDIRRRFESTLHPKELAVFQLRHNSHKTFEEIGQELRIKPGTAKVRYHRALTRFKAWLEKRYPDIYYSLSEGGE